MAKKLFVGGLPYETTEAELEEIFSKVGKVESANIITDRNTGRSRGFGFVEMAEDADAEKAIKELNDTDLKGRKLMVSPAKPREENPPER